MSKQLRTALLLLVSLPFCYCDVATTVYSGSEEGFWDEDSNERRLGGHYDDYGPYTLDMRGFMQIEMFASEEGQGAPTKADINTYFDATEHFYLDTFDKFRRTRGHILNFRMGFYEFQYFPASRETDMISKFLISWRGQAIVRGDAKVKLNQIGQAMKNANYADYIQNYLWDANNCKSRWCDVQAVRYEGKPILRLGE